ncbi:MAG: penicillin-binding protein 2, partial [Chloroflexi bacterium]
MFRAIIVFSFGLIALQLFNIQINSGDLYSRLAEKNRFRLIADEVPRGIVYDRNGAILVRNTPNYVIAILPADLPDDKFERTVIYTRLAQILH